MSRSVPRVERRYLPARDRELRALLLLLGAPSGPAAADPVTPTGHRTSEGSGGKGTA
jgi:hypothetical protein